jgi:hypothetical protein
MIIWGTFAIVSSCNEVHSLCSPLLNISQNIIFNTALFVKHLCLYLSFYIRRLTGWRGFGERLAAVSTWIQGNWFQNKIIAPEVEFLDEIQTIVFRVFLLVIHSHL